MAKQFDQEDQERRDAELGYRTAGARELGLRDWMSMQGEPGEAAPSPKAFQSLINVLRAKKWAKANPVRRLEILRSYGKRHRAKETVRVKAWRHARIRALVVTCGNPECGGQWCCVPGGQHRGRRILYCSPGCFNRARYLRAKNRAARPERRP